MKAEAGRTERTSGEEGTNGPVVSHTEDDRGRPVQLTVLRVAEASNGGVQVMVVWGREEAYVGVFPSRGLSGHSNFPVGIPDVVFRGAVRQTGRAGVAGDKWECEETRWISCATMVVSRRSP